MVTGLRGDAAALATGQLLASRSAAPARSLGRSLTVRSPKVLSEAAGHDPLPRSWPSFKIIRSSLRTSIGGALAAPDESGTRRRGLAVSGVAGGVGRDGPAGHLRRASPLIRWSRSGLDAGECRVRGFASRRGLYTSVAASSALTTSAGSAAVAPCVVGAVSRLERPAGCSGWPSGTGSTLRQPRAEAALTAVRYWLSDIRPSVRARISRAPSETCHLRFKSNNVGQSARVGNSWAMSSAGIKKAAAKEWACCSTCLTPHIWSPCMTR